MQSDQSGGIDVREYVAILRRHVWLIVICTVAFGVAAFLYSNSKTPMYEATAQLLYEQPLDISDPLSGGNIDANTQALQLDSAVTIISGPELSDEVAGVLGDPATWPPYSVSAAVVVSDTNSGSLGTGLTVSATSPDPDWAARVANAYAEQFIEWRKANELKRVQDAKAVVESQLKQFTTPEQRALAEYVILSQRLSNLAILEDTITANFRLISKASPPGAPYAPQPYRTAAMGAVVGFLLGCGISFLREKLDTSLRNHREVGKIMDLPIVGRIPRIPEDALNKGSLVVISEADGRAAESMRVLRSNLEFVSLGEEHRVLMICSAQKGEGKSLVTANLAASLALAGKRVVLVDADLRRPRVHRLFSTRNTSGVSSIIAGQTKLQDALQVHELLPGAVGVGGNGKGAGRSGDADTGPRLWLLTSGPIPPNPGEMVASQRFAQLILQLREMEFDYVLIDSPAFLAVGDAAPLAAVVDGIFLLVNMRMTNRPLLEDARDFLAQLPAQRLGVITVIDQTGSDERYHYYANKY